MAEVQGPISANDLMSKLVQAKKVMNKVDGGNYERGNIDESILRSDPEEFMNSSSPAPSATKNVTATPSADRIMQSNLPDAIKKAMISSSR